MKTTNFLSSLAISAALVSTTGFSQQVTNPPPAPPLAATASVTNAPAPPATNATAATTNKKSPAKATNKKSATKKKPLKTVPLVAGPATVIASNVNVRGQARLKGEV